MQAAVRELLRRVTSGASSVVPTERFRDWHPRLVALSEGGRSPFEVALLAGFEADRLAWAFSAGYQAAGRVLAPGLGYERVWSLCATEAEGAHPRAIQTTLAPAQGGYRIDGDKRWATLANESGTLFVLAARGTSADGRKDLRLVRVEAGAPGLSLSASPPPPFVPEIGHARVRFDGVLVSEEAVLPGDGYTDYVKPFRTVEDLHVHGALAGYLAGAAGRHRWPPTVLAELLVLAEGLGVLAGQDLRSPEVHLGLGGSLGLLRRLLADLEPLWERSDPAEAARWRRDRPLLDTAGRARQARFEKAWTALASHADPNH